MESVNRHPRRIIGSPLMRPLRPGPRAIVTATFPQVSAVCGAHLHLRIYGSSRWVSPAASLDASKSASMAGSTAKQFPRLIPQFNGSPGVSTRWASPQESSVQKLHVSSARSLGGTWVRLPTADHRSNRGHPPASPPRTGSQACQRLAFPPFPPGPQLRVLGSLPAAARRQLRQDTRRATTDGPAEGAEASSAGLQPRPGESKHPSFQGSALHRAGGIPSCL